MTATARLEEVLNSIGFGRFYCVTFLETEGRLLAKQAPLGYIIFSLSVSSSRLDQVYNFELEIRAAKEKFGADVVRVVNMADYSLDEQARIAMNSAVYFTNHGGVTGTTIFVQKLTGVFVFWHGKGRMDHDYHESSLFRTTWFSVEDRPHLNRTMALLDAEIERTALDWPGVLCYQGAKEGQGVVMG